MVSMTFLFAIKIPSLINKDVLFSNPKKEIKYLFNLLETFLINKIEGFT